MSDLLQSVGIKLCRDCDHVHSSTRKLSPFKWVCLKAPRLPEIDERIAYVDPDWRPDPPYWPCAMQNPNGLCEEFSPRRNPPQGEQE